ncbi:MAG TPA: RNA methyltransferase [Cryomorphaceae bacterium]|nr:RNA methyltransferase [Owenweeksia sp.]MBF99526.1 RNA methyltransferase [Owenweeksia sp.]HAD98670.1 RNA methyltransferase [Cryomorphaceae bacterium]|tara:strand:- start:1221 stop:2366 length:1146 start_codon:yes stop_codon:yes gene_type:complete
MLAKTYFGLESVLAKELQLLGARNVKTINRGVSFEGDLGFLYKANLWTRTALRILVPIANFKVRNEDELYKKVKDLDWEDYFEVNKTFVIDANVFARQFKNSLFIAQRVKDGIVDRFRDKTGRRPTVFTKDPDIRINVHISNENVTISLDSSGDSLHKRGYRSEADRAPISEVLAAGILKLTGWDGLRDFIDPMCGSGTLLIEAALMAHNIPPNIFRKNFSFKHWKGYDPELFGLLFDKALEKEKNFHFSIYGFDKEAYVLRKAEKNLRNALMHEQVETAIADFMNFRKPGSFRDTGLVVFNPPYGEKMEADIPALYKGIGDTLKREFAGFEVWVFTSSSEGLKNVGLKPSKKIQLYNGKLESWLVKYDIYKGSKKHVHKD